MVTSDEERQGVNGQDAGPAAAPAGAPQPNADSPLGSGEPDTAGSSAQEEAAPEEAVAEPADPVAPKTDAPFEEPIPAETPMEWLAVAPAATPEPAAPQPLADPAAGAEISEDEATGRRVESLLAETPDADPQAPQPARGDVIAPLIFDAPAPFGPDVEDEPTPPPPPATPFREGLRRNGMDRVGPIVAFDFDGTLTVRDSFTAFLRWREGSARYHAEMAALAPAALKYLFDRDPGKLKAAAVRRFLQGLPREVLNQEAMEFAAVSAPLLFRPDALRAWRRYRQDGARLVIVTASPENIVAPFARGLGCDLLLATQLLFDQNDRVQGGLLGDNCRGPEKVRRIRQALGENVVLAAAYGDTDGDLEMLDMAEQQFMRLFVGTPGKPGGPG